MGSHIHWRILKKQTTLCASSFKNLLESDAAHLQAMAKATALFAVDALCPRRACSHLAPPGQTHPTGCADFPNSSDNSDNVIDAVEFPIHLHLVLVRGIVHQRFALKAIFRFGQQACFKTLGQ